MLAALETPVMHLADLRQVGGEQCQAEVPLGGEECQAEVPLGGQGSRAIRGARWRVISSFLCLHPCILRSIKNRFAPSPPPLCGALLLVHSKASQVLTMRCQATVFLFQARFLPELPSSPMRAAARDGR